MAEHKSAAEQADELSRRRARVLPLLAVVYLSQQVSFFTTPPPAELRTVDLVKIGAWLFLSVVLILGLTTSGFWFHSRQIRGLLNDEVTRAHRADALQTGFLFAMIAAMVSYVLGLVEPLSSREAAHIILSAGIGAALVRFGLLERRAHGG